MNGKTRRRGVVAGMLLALVVAAGAYAYWTNSGGGTGSATTANPAGGLLSATNSSVSGLAPGAGAQTFDVTISNSGSSDIQASSLSAVVTTDKAGCDNTDYSVTLPDISAGVNVPASGSTAAIAGGSIDFVNKATNQDACKGATVTLTYTVG